MRTLFCLTVLILSFCSTAAQTKAVQLIITTPASASGLVFTSNVADVFTFRTVLGESYDYSWDIPSLTVNDAGTVFTLDETTAASYGADWNLIHNRFSTVGNIRVILEKRHLNSIHGASHPLNLGDPKKITVPTDLHSVSLTFTTTPATNSPQVLHLHPVFTYHITAQFPEPSAVVLALIGSVALIRVRSRG